MFITLTYRKLSMNTIYHNAQGQAVKSFQEGPLLGASMHQTAEAGIKANII